jgi:hypothetical protein
MKGLWIDNGLGREIPDESKNAFNSGLAAHIVDVIFPEFERALIPVSCFKLD